MALTADERTDIETGADAGAKLARLDALTDDQLEDLLGANLEGDDGPATAAEKRQFRRKRLRRIRNANSDDRVRAEINIVSVQGSDLTYADFEDFTGNEKNLINSYAKSLEESNRGFSVPKDVLKAIDTQDLFDACKDVFKAAATNAQINTFIRKLRRFI